MKKAWYKSIAFKTAVFAWILIMLTVAVYLMAILPSERSILLNEMQKDAGLIATSLRLPVSSLKSDSSYPHFINALSPILKNNEALAYIMLTDSAGRSLVITKSGWSREELTGDWSLSDEVQYRTSLSFDPKFEEQVYRYSLPITNKESRWAWVQVGFLFNKFKSNSSLNKVYYRAFFLGALLIAMGIVLSFFFSKRILKPIKYLEETAGRIASGDLSAKAEINTGDEFEDLAETFNSMTETINKSRNELLETHNYTDNILRSMANILIVVNPDRTIRTVNRAAIELLGYPEEELIGRQAGSIILEDKERGLGLDSLIAKKNLRNVPLYYQAKDNKKIPVSFSGTVMYDSNNTVQGIVCVAQDITERKEAEEALIRAHDELEIRVAERTYELETMNDTLQREVKERKRAEEQIKNSLVEKEVLLKEVHHRVKNNLQVISSLLYLNSRNIKDKEALDMFQDSQNRVKSIALVHERLYKSEDLGRIDLYEYINMLTKDLAMSYGVDHSRINLEIIMKDVSIGIDNAVPCGLIINELISNSLKYAFPNGKSGTIRAEASYDKDEGYCLSVSDNGIGLAKDLDIDKLQSLGIQLVRSLVKQLDGTLEIGREGGTSFKIRFKEQLKKKNRQ